MLITITLQRKKKKLVISGHCLSQKTLVLDDFAQTLQIGMGL